MKTTTTRPLALRPREAAKVLGVSERWLWGQTKAGNIPCVKVGRCTLYVVEALEQWLREQAGKREGGEPS